MPQRVKQNRIRVRQISVNCLFFQDIPHFFRGIFRDPLLCQKTAPFS